MGFEGPRCEIWLLPGCRLGDHPIPIRSWVLHAFHDNKRRRAWTGPGKYHPLGPVPCSCLLQFVSTPYLLERTRLQFMRSFNVQCVDLPTGLTLAQFVEEPHVAQGASPWRVFSFGAVHDALRLGAMPALTGAPLEAGPLPRLVQRLQQLQKQGLEPSRRRFAGYHVETLRPTLPPCLLPLDAVPVRHKPHLPPLVPLAQCGAARCGGVGWCEDVTGTPTCGCFLPGGLEDRVGGPACGALDLWRADKQDNQAPVHWGSP